MVLIEMIGNLTIAPRTVKILQYIESLDKELLDKIQKYFETTKPKIRSKDIVADIIEVTSLQENNISKIVDFIISTYSVLESIESKWTDMAKDVEKYVNEKIRENEEKALDWTKVHSFLSKILTSQFLKISQKGIKLISSYHNVFVGKSLILSDIRSIFEDEIEEKPNFAVITHNLKIEYQSDDKIKEFHLSLDIDDLKNLKETIERAISKHDTLKEVMDCSEIYILR